MAKLPQQGKGHGAIDPGRVERIRVAASQGVAGRFWYGNLQKQAAHLSKVYGLPKETIVTIISTTSPTKPVVAVGPSGKRSYARGAGVMTNTGLALRGMRAASRGYRASDAVRGNTPSATQQLRRYEDCVDTTKDPEGCFKQTFHQPDRQKTHAFAHAILGDESRVTVDRIYGRVLDLPTTNIYRVKSGKKVVQFTSRVKLRRKEVLAAAEQRAGGPLPKAAVAESTELAITPTEYEQVVRETRLVARTLGWTPAQVMAAGWTAGGGSGSMDLLEARSFQGRVRSRSRAPVETHKRKRAPSAREKAAIAKARAQQRAYLAENVPYRPNIFDPLARVANRFLARMTARASR